MQAGRLDPPTSTYRRARRRLGQHRAALRRRWRERFPTASPADAYPGAGAGRREPQVMAYFADPPVNLYQLRQWLEPLRRLDERHPVFVLTREPRTYAALARETPLPVVLSSGIAGVDALLARADVKVALYVNQSVANFQVLRYPDLLHVFLNHGESDKLYMATNQVKAYDVAFVAGQAAVDRFRLALLDFDADARLVTVGRPQLDAVLPAAEPGPRAGATGPPRTTVLYAPTWEGDRPSTAYGSVASHGAALVRAFTGTGRHRLVYRPHPRTGATSHVYRAAAAEVRRLVADAARRDPAAGHRIDEDPLFGPQLVEADALICDVSAVALDFLPMGKPLFLATPAEPAALVDRAGVMGSCYEIAVDDLPDVVAIVDERIRDDVGAERRRPWVEYHFGDVRPGASLARFLDAVDTVVHRRDALLAAKRARIAAHSGPAASGT